MSTVLTEVKKRRQLEAHREILTNPWYRTFAPALPLLPLLLLLGVEFVLPRLFAFGGTSPATSPARWLILAAVVVWSLVSTLILLRKRERAWLALIENECPRLHRELTSPRR